MLVDQIMLRVAPAALHHHELVLLLTAGAGGIVWGLEVISLLAMQHRRRHLLLQLQLLCGM